MREGMEIIDGHMHLFTDQLIERIKSKIERRGEAYRRAYKTWYERYTAKYDSELPEENSDPPEKIAQDWARELDAHGIDLAFFVAIESEDQDLTAFLNAKRVKQEGYVGLKLYPPKEYFLPSDRSLYPLYEEARFLQISIMFHMGILLSYDADLRFANPLELHPVARDFPDINFFIAHFGAGYFQEVLFLGYHVQNLYLDT